LSAEQILNIVRDHQLGLTISDILEKHLDQPLASDQPVQATGEDSILSTLLEENRELKQLVGDLMLEIRAEALHRGSSNPLPDENASPIDFAPAQPVVAATAPEEHDLATPFAIAHHGHAARHTASREPVSSLLNRSRIIPAIRGPEYIKAAIASPSVIVWLLYGTPLTLPQIVRQLRSAGKLPVANLDLLTGFAHDGDGIELLAAEGIAGVVSTRQSVLRAARAQGIITVQRTFLVDSIAVGNITRALQHFQSDAVELLPAAAAPLYVFTLRAAQPKLPVIATGLVTSMRQVEDLFQCGVSSVATSDLSLWVL
jgi:glycerol uptake operon antiterminator